MMSGVGDVCGWCPRGGSNGWCDVNYGIFLFNATHPVGRRVLEAWHDESARERCLDLG